MMPNTLTLNEKLQKFLKKLMMTSVDQKRLSVELPDDKCYHDGQSDLSESLVVQFRVMFQEELKAINK